MAVLESFDLLDEQIISSVSDTNRFFTWTPMGEVQVQKLADLAIQIGSELDIDSLSLDLSNAQDAIDELNNTKLPALQADLDELNNVKIPALEADLDDLNNNQLPALQADIDDLNLVQLPDLDSRLDTLETTKVPALETNVDELNTIKIPALENDLSNLNDVELPALQADIDDLNLVQLPDLDSRLDTLETTDIPALESDLADLNDVELPALQADIDTKLTDGEGVIDISKFADGLAPIERVDTLPSPGNVGRIVFLTTDNTVYRDTGSEWTSNVSATNITGQITETQINDASITTPKIATGAIIATKIGAGEITANEIASRTILANNIGADQITAFEIASDTITANEIFAGTITSNEIATDTITANEIFAGTITSNEIATDTITTNNIGADQITANEIESDTITANEIAVDSITTNELDVNQIVGNTAFIDSLVSSTVWTETLIANTAFTSSITSELIWADKITANYIASDTITANEIASDTITANEIGVGTITALEIASDTITANEIGAGVITANEIGANEITANLINVAQLSALSASMGVLTAGRIQNGAGNMVIDADGSLIQIDDTQTTPQRRINIGKLGTATTDWGLEVFDQDGNLVLGADGLGTNVVGTGQVIDGSITADKITVNDLFALNATLGSYQIFGDRFESISPQGGMEFNASDPSIKLYEDDGVTQALLFQHNASDPTSPTSLIVEKSITSLTHTPPPFAIGNHITNSNSVNIENSDVAIEITFDIETTSTIGQPVTDIKARLEMSTDGTNWDVVSEIDLESETQPSSWAVMGHTTGYSFARLSFFSGAFFQGIDVTNIKVNEYKTKTTISNRGITITATPNQRFAYGVGRLQGLSKTTEIIPAPDVPNFTASNESKGGNLIVELKWDPPMTQPISEYIIEENKDSQGYEPIARVKGTQFIRILNSITINNPSSVFEYRIKAINKKGFVSSNWATSDVTVSNSDSLVVQSGSLLGTANQVSVTTSNGAVLNDDITLSLPQSISPSDIVEFAGVNIGTDPVWHAGNFDPATKINVGDPITDNQLSFNVPLKNQSNTFSGTQTFDNGIDTVVRVLSDDTGASVIELLGNSQGTGRVYVGQSTSNGGGIEYNGDGSPVTTGGGNDYITLWRRSDGVDHWTARNLHTNNDWEFRGVVRANSGFNVNGTTVIDSDRNFTGREATFLTGAGTAFIEQLGGASVSLRSSGFLRLESNITSGVRLYTGDTLITEAVSDRFRVDQDLQFQKVLKAGSTTVIDSNQNLFSGKFKVVSGIPEIDLNGSRLVLTGDSSVNRDAFYFNHGGTRIWTTFINANGDLRFFNDAGGGNFVIDSSTLNALGSNGIDVRRGLTGGYGQTTDASSNWAANIWSIGNSWSGSGHGSGFTKASSHYGLMWVRENHPEATSAGEGLYLWRGGINYAELGRIRFNLNVPITTNDSYQIAGVPVIDSDRNLAISSKIFFDGMGNTSGDYISYATQEGITYFENGSPAWRLTGAGKNFINGGDLGIGTQTPAQKLDVAGNIAVNGTTVIDSDRKGTFTGVDSSGDIHFQNNALISAGSGTNTDHIWHDDGANEWHFVSDGSYKQQGNTTIVAGDFMLSSDRRLKTNITDLTEGLSVIDMLLPATYKKEGKFESGFIAQDIRDVLPHIVRGNEDEGYLSISSIQLIPYLTKAIQELHREVKSLKMKHARLR